jgi:hypothetical protein
MTRVFERQRFEDFYDRNSGRVFADLEFRHCTFVSSSISITRNPRYRSLVRNVTLIQCEEIGCALDTAVVETVVVDGLKTSDLFQTWGAVFKHVTLKGKIGRIMISPAVAAGLATPAQQKAFDKANAEFYSTVDWALDISEAEFEEADIRGIPARLIRRDLETQVVITRGKALEGRWRQLDLSKTYWPTAIEFFLQDSEDPDLVLVAPKRDRDYLQLLKGLQLLREAGIAEPD